MQRRNACHFLLQYSAISDNYPQCRSAGTTGAGFGITSATVIHHCARGHTDVMLRTAGALLVEPEEQSYVLANRYTTKTSHAD